MDQQKHEIAVSNGPRVAPVPAVKTKSKTTLVIFLALMGVFLVFDLRMCRPYLLAVAFGGILALLGQPLYRQLRKVGVKPKLASTAVTLGIVLLVLGPLSGLLALTVKQAIHLGQVVATNGSYSPRSLLDRVTRIGPVRSIIGDPEKVEARARSAIQTTMKSVSSAFVGVLADVPAALLQLALAGISCFFFVIDGRRFVDWMLARLPLDSDVRVEILRSFRDTTISVVWATLAAAGAQSLLMLAAYLALGVPLAFLAAGATFIFAWIPMVGSVPIWVLGAIYLYTQGSPAKMVAMILAGLVIGVVDNFVRPMVLKGRSEIHPLVGLVAIFGGIAMFGIVGVFIGPILTAVLIALLEIWPRVAARYGLNWS